MKIDLHCHTKKVKKGDSPNRNVDAATFASALERADVKIAAITNHNHFDLQQYLCFRESAKETADIWPGVELDVHGSQSDSWWHMIVVASPSHAEHFSKMVQTLMQGQDPNTVRFNFKDVFASFSSIDCVFISHCHDKKPFVSDEDIAEMLMAFSEPWRLFFEPRQMTTVGIWSNHGWNMLLGSDVQDWSKYPDRKLPELRLPVSSFEQFYLLAKRDGTTVSTLLNSTSSRPLVAHPHEDVDIPLQIYEEINVLFGQKGTGKTKIAKSLEESLVALGCQCSSYYGGERSEAFASIISTNGITQDISVLERPNCSADIESILNWKDTTATPISDYVKWLRTKENNKNKARFKLSESRSLPPIAPSDFQNAKKRAEAASSFSKSYEEMQFEKYLSKAEREQFMSLLSKIVNASQVETIRCFIDRESTRLANEGLEKLKQEIDAKSDTKSMPSTTGFLHYALNRIELFKRSVRICKSLEPEEKSIPEYLGTLEDKGVLEIVTSYRLLCKESRTTEFAKKISTLKAWAEAIKRVRNCAIGSECSNAVSAFATQCRESGIASLDEFVGVRKYVRIKDSSTQYEPSTGEQGIILLERVLDNDADAYILDEPEAGMSNSYIDAVIRPKVQKLAKLGKTVIIATHNANLAVRTLPYQSIYRLHINGNEYATYIGNPFVDELRELSGENSLSWSECSMLTLEGGSEAFYDRKNIYEAGQK